MWSFSSVAGAKLLLVHTMQNDNLMVEINRTHVLVMVVDVAHVAATLMCLFVELEADDMSLQSARLLSQPSAALGA